MWEDHLRHLDSVLRVLQKQWLYAKLSKCEFKILEILYLGNVISHEGVSMEKYNIFTI